jgi:triosephosphate isomerase (TIM)
MIVINLKNYKIGEDVLNIVRKIEIYYPKAIVAVPAVDLKYIAKSRSSNTLQIYSQHMDYQEPGKGTGFITPEAIISAGASGSLLNHSEHPVSLGVIKKTIKRSNEIGLKLIVCTSTLKEVEDIKKLNPYAIAFEDKKLIATGKSITDYKADEIKKFVKLLDGSEIIPLCGAGITSGEDVAAALVLGCKGVLVASAIANSQEPEKFLKEISQLL